MKGILVTGASSGIGLDITKVLSNLGHYVYATYRNESDYHTLKIIDNVKPIKLDVRVYESIQQVKNEIMKDGHGLYGLVNNAGVGGLGLYST